MAESALRYLDQMYMMGIGQGPTAPRPQRTRGQEYADMLGAASLPLSGVPIAGDIAGFAADAAMYAAYPEERTMGNYAMSALGGLPLIPGAAALRAARSDPIDMSTEARMQRAAEQGFDQRVFYHGGSSEFDEFANQRRGNYFTDNPKIADIYAENAERRWPRANNASPNVMPVRLRGRPLVVSDQRDGSGGWLSNNLADVLGVDLSGTPVARRGQVLREEANKQGYGFLEVTDMDDLGGRQTQFVALDPSNIRSVNAAFDPVNRGSANILATAAGGTIGLSALRQLMPQEEERPIE